MTIQQFEDNLRQLLQREPFQPFVAELTNGSAIEIQHPRVTINGGAAAFLQPATDKLITFSAEITGDLRLLPQAPSSLTKEQFEDTLRLFLRRQPFVPFLVERVDGTTIEIDEPSVAFNEGSAVFMSSSYELLEFDWQEVREIRGDQSPRICER